MIHSGGFTVDPKVTEAKIREWAIDPKLQKAHGTQFRRLRETLIDAQHVSFNFGIVDASWERQIKAVILGGQFQIFTVEHDWAAAFANAQDVDFEAGVQNVKLPYPASVFEFVINGLRVCVIMIQDTGDFHIVGSVAFLQTPMGWAAISLSSPHMLSVKRLIEGQIRSICIALDAEVAQTEVVRAPHKLNRARVRRGRIQIPDYHVIKLARRTRPEPLSEFQTVYREQRHVRLHFRRGHWRHFENHKTWIKWTLVGDPDLGFIDKHYRL